MLEKKAASGIMLTLLLVGMLTLAFNIQPVKASGTIYIRADGSVDPSTAPIQRDGDLYTFTNNIYDSIVVKRGNIIIDGNGYTLQGSGGYTSGFLLSDINNVTIQNTNITNFQYGISLYESSNNTVFGNNITNNNEGGVWIHRSFKNTVFGNNIINNYWDGIHLGFSSFNTVYENNVTNNRDGVVIYSSSNNTVSQNFITNNTYLGVWLGFSSGNVLRNNIVAGSRYNFGVDASIFKHFVQDVDASNRVDGKPVYYWIGRRNVTVPSDAAYVALVNCYNITAKGLELKNNNQGMLLANTTNSKITNSIITNNHLYGVWLYSSSNNTVAENIIMNNAPLYTGGGGVGLEYLSSRNTFSGNDIIKNEFGVLLLSGSNNNLFYHNNFINNTRQQINKYFYGNHHPNVWDDGYPSGGNYWSDYEEKYPDAQELDGSGIWDMPYVIDENNQDNYPLMNPWTLTPPVVTAIVDMDPDTLNLKSKGRWIAAYIELPEGYDVNDINVSSTMLNGTIPVDTEAPTAMGDYDEDGVPDLMVKFNRTAVSEFILSNGIKYGNVSLTLTGQLTDGISFEGSDILMVRMPGDINVDGKADILDLVLAAKAYGTYLNHPRWNPIADEKEDHKIDIIDLVLIARNFGKTYQ